MTTGHAFFSVALDSSWEILFISHTRLECSLHKIYISYTFSESTTKKLIFLKFNNNETNEAGVVRIVMLIKESIFHSLRNVNINLL